MATFSHLPNELIVEIWSHVLQPKDIENFALTSKTIRALSGKVLTEHKNLTKDLSAFDAGGPKSKFSVAGLLKQILLKPHIALYIKTFTITTLHDEWQVESEGVNTLQALDPKAGEDGHQYRHAPYGEEDVELFKQAVKRAKPFFNFPRPETRCQCHSPDAEEIIDQLQDGIEYGDEVPITVLLLLLSTNLKSISVMNSEADLGFYDTLRYISQGRGIEFLKRPVEVRILFDRQLPSEKGIAEYDVRKRVGDVLGGEDPELMVEDRCISFSLRAWSSTIQGTWTR